MRASKLVVAALSLAAVVVLPQNASATPVNNSAIPSAGCDLSTISVQKGQTESQSITSGYQSRTYLIHVPQNYQVHQKKPLVLAFHGRNGTGYDIEGFSEIDALDAIAVYPIGLIGADNKTAWQGAPYAAGTSDVQFVADLLDHLQATLCVDPKGIYAVGKSNGGGFAALLACQMPLRIAAFGVVAGALYDGTKDGCAESGPAPVIDFHGSSDPIADYDGEPNNNGGALPSIWQWSKDRATHDGCAPTPVTTQINSGVIKYAWGSCQGTTEVTHYKVIGGGHTWPDAPVDSGPGPETDDIGATQVIWAFFLAHPLNVQINS